MARDANLIHELVKHRSFQVAANEEKVKKHNMEWNEDLKKMRVDLSNIRNAKNDAKEAERMKLTRTLMANLVSSADYPDAPPYVHHMINVFKNIMGNVNIYILYYILYIIYIYI